MLQLAFCWSRIRKIMAELCIYAVSGPWLLEFS